MIDFARALPAIRKRVQRRSQDRAAVARARAGDRRHAAREDADSNRQQGYARANNSFGLTTLLDQHVQIKGASVTFHFRAKSGVMQTIEVNDPALARIVKRCRQMPGETLFQYVDAEGKRQSRRLHRRERVSARDHRAIVYGEEFQDMGSDGARRESRVRFAGVHVGHGVQAEHRARRRCRRGEAGEHARGLPGQLHPSRGVRGLQGGRDDRGRQGRTADGPSVGGRGGRARDAEEPRAAQPPRERSPRYRIISSDRSRSSS